MKKYLLPAFAVLILLISAVLYVEYSFSSLRIRPFYDGCLKIWGHQGQNDIHEEKSLERFQYAFDSGAAGIEFDILYDIGMKSFVVSHKHSYAQKNGGLLTLEEVFRRIGNRGYFWLDLKNLVDLNGSELTAAAENMSVLLDGFNLKNRVIIESKMAAKLAAFGKRGMFTCLWITPGRVNTRFEAWLKMFLYKLRFIKGHFSAFSMNYVNYSPHIQNILRHVPVHLFTLNDESEIMSYLYLANVKIILSDKTNNFSLDSCDEQKL